jgi:hypothetical protein
MYLINILNLLSVASATNILLYFLRRQSLGLIDGLMLGRSPLLFFFPSFR